MSEKVFIIAEAGVNHNGSLELAYKLIDAASEAGADAVKFQTFKAENIVSAKAQKADYQIQNTGNNETQFEMIKKLELKEEDHHKLKDYAQKKGILFLSTPFDLESVDFLASMDLGLFKIPSGEITNLPYLRKIGAFKKPIILSTGMSTLKEVQEALGVLIKAGTPKEMITVLHCNTEYPTPFEDVNLRAMLTMREKLEVKVGYSDHTLGIEVSIAAVAMGACLIEKHFTLDKKLPGPDHVASLEPDELKKMVQAIRHIEKSLGDGEKKPSKSELKNIVVARKSIVAKENIKRGEIYTASNLTIKRPGNGISPMSWDQVLGKKASRDYLADELIEL